MIFKPTPEQWTDMLACTAGCGFMVFGELSMKRSWVLISSDFTWLHAAGWEIWRRGEGVPDNFSALTAQEDCKLRWVSSEEFDRNEMDYLSERQKEFAIRDSAIAIRGVLTPHDQAFLRGMGWKRQSHNGNTLAWPAEYPVTDDQWSSFLTLSAWGPRFERIPNSAHDLPRHEPKLTPGSSGISVWREGDHRPSFWGSGKAGPFGLVGQVMRVDGPGEFTWVTTEDVPGPLTINRNVDPYESHRILTQAKGIESGDSRICKPTCEMLVDIEHPDYV